MKAGTEGAATLPPSAAPHVVKVVTKGAASPTLPPPAALHAAVPCVQPKAQPRRSTRHPVAADGSSGTDEHALSKAMRRKAAMMEPTNAGTSKKMIHFYLFFLL